MSKSLGLSLILVTVLAFCFPAIARPANPMKAVYYNADYTVVCGIRGIDCEYWGITTPYRQVMDCEEPVPGMD